MREISILKSNLAEKIETKKVVGEKDYTLNHSKNTPLKEIQSQELNISRGLSTIEIKAISLISIVLFGLLLLNVQTDLQLTTSSRNVQDLNSEIQTNEIEIENLEQHVHELSRYDRIHKIAEDYGLTLHEENIRNLSPLE